MITTGVTGRPWRASVTEWGAIEPWDDSPGLKWFVAADDRWHIPAEEQSVRQQRIEGTPVTETRVRVPNGDVVQRVYSVADAGGLTVVEVENESTLPVAVAFDHRRVLTERPVVDMPIEGIDLPDTAFVLPLAHTASIRVALPHGPSTERVLPQGVASPMQVVRGWHTLISRAGRFLLPDGERGAALAESADATRCEIALGTFPAASDDPAGFTLSLDQLVRMGDQPDPWIPELVDAVEQLGPVDGWDADVALDAALHILAAAGERRARRDLEGIIGDRRRSQVPAEPPTRARGVAWLESRLARHGALLPDGVPAEWLGQSIEAYGIPTAAGSTLSFAVRWHGERPAVLWEQTGDPVTLTCPAIAPGWTTSDPKGEALWPAPPGVRPLSSPGDAGSFS